MVKIDIKDGKIIEYEKNSDQGYYMDGLLKTNLDNIKKTIRKDWDYVFVVDGEVGCLTGDTPIRYSRGKICRVNSLKKLYENYKHKSKCSTWHWDNSIPTYIRSWNGTEIRLNKIKDMYYRGKKHVYSLLLENQKQIKSTADHKILTRNGWKELQKLTKYDEVMCDNPKPTRKDRKKVKLRDAYLTVGKNHPYSTGTSNKRVSVHRLIYEAHLNNMGLIEFLDIVLNEPKTCKTLKFIDPSIYHIHHIDGNHYNNLVSNLKCVLKKDHLKYHTKGNYANFNQGVPLFSKVKNIVYKGYEDTYDIECEAPHHNFAANEIIVHNSGKSTFAQQVAWYLADGDLQLKEITFTANGFKKSVVEGRQYKAVIFDEAFRGASSRSSLSKVNRDIIKLMQEVRQKNLFIFFILPSIWDLDKNIKLHRCKGVFHVHTRGNRERGYWKYYPNDMGDRDYNAFQRFFDNSPNKYAYPARRQLAGIISGRYTKWLPPSIDEVAYKKKKLGAFNLSKSESEGSGVQVNATAIKNVIVDPNLMDQAKKMGMNMSQLSQLLGVPYSTITYWIKSKKFENFKKNLENEEDNVKKGDNTKQKVNVFDDKQGGNDDSKAFS